MNTRNYFKLSLIISMLILIVSCDRNNDNKFTRNYILENGTEHKIELRFYKLGVQIFDFENQNVLNDTGAVFSQSVIEDSFAPAEASGAFQGADSLIIVFNNTRKSKIIWDGDNTTLEGISKNLFSDEVYIIENNENYRYVFIEQDYNNAIDCNGNCD
ncbi:hypothetical protein M4I21_05130 [Cellulophaga sp. 20_2_10]|uniref:hypothetical protein n=1 Tax=Cellulophaga sp. 20_2_10 TaxID=2942476 RepID=UPI00201A3FA4|nr:hypothetical protein [Cellulophaga sp. 20_2_10]MCL5245181.1 hypothetical protein [Cellulophaga sp. 20_2_10]